jgi:hypothetical protein
MAGKAGIGQLAYLPARRWGRGLAAGRCGLVRTDGPRAARRRWQLDAGVAEREEIKRRDHGRMRPFIALSRAASCSSGSHDGRGGRRAAHSYEPTREAGFKIRVTYLGYVQASAYQALRVWRITRIRSTPAALIGYCRRPTPSRPSRKPSRDTGSATRRSRPGCRSG